MAKHSNMVTLSIITPCSRPENLPAIYLSILQMKVKDVEWLVVFTGKKDMRIKQYEKDVPIRLFSIKIKTGIGKGGQQRNEALKHVRGKYIYYLDDDNLVHPKLLEKINLYGDKEKVLVFNRFSENRKRYLRQFNVDKMRKVPGYIDTGQLIVPSKYKHVEWPDERENIEEFDYIRRLISEAGEEKIQFVDRIFTYRNYLRRFEL